jgi:hypothetical protein
MLLLGVLTMVAVALAMAVALRLANKQETLEGPPTSIPSDFVAPSSRRAGVGGYAWRTVDESPEQFRARVALENAPAQTPDKRG